jgi:hypothetical protein
MPRQDLMDLVLQQFSAGEVRTLEEIVAAVGGRSSIVSEAEVRSAILSLLRRNELLLTDQFGLQQADGVLAA